jgi:hypothetical protein
MLLLILDMHATAADMDQCSNDWQACCGPSGSDAPADYNTMLGSCGTARDDMTNVQSFFAGMGSGSGLAFTSSVVALNATGQLLAGLPSNTVRSFGLYSLGQVFIHM